MRYPSAEVAMNTPMMSPGPVSVSVSPDADWLELEELSDEAEGDCEEGLFCVACWPLLGFFKGGVGLGEEEFVSAYIPMIIKIMTTPAPIPTIILLRSMRNLPSFQSTLTPLYRTCKEI